MMDRPHLGELLEAVRDFLEQKAMPELKGHTAFHARVAVNVLNLALREVALAPAAAAAEKTRLLALLGGPDGDLETLNRELCRRIASGQLAVDDQALIRHLRATTQEKLKIDNPKYKGVPATPAARG